MPPAARISDTTAHGTPLSPGPGSPNVLIGGQPAWRAMTDTHVCPMPLPGTPPPGPHGPEKVLKGSTSVLINSMPAARMGDQLIGAGPPNSIVMGEPTVVIG